MPTEITESRERSNMTSKLADNSTVIERKKESWDGAEFKFQENGQVEISRKHLEVQVQSPEGQTSNRHLGVSFTGAMFRK